MPEPQTHPAPDHRDIPSALIALIPDTHTGIGYIAALTITALAFMYPEKVTGFDTLASAYGILIGAVGVGAVAKGGQRRLQGGSTAPDTINPPLPNGT